MDKQQQRCWNDSRNMGVESSLTLEAILISCSFLFENKKKKSYSDYDIRLVKQHAATLIRDTNNTVYVIIKRMMLNE